MYTAVLGMEASFMPRWFSTGSQLLSCHSWWCSPILSCLVRPGEKHVCRQPQEALWKKGTFIPFPWGKWWVYFPLCWLLSGDGLQVGLHGPTWKLGSGNEGCHWFRPRSALPLPKNALPLCWKRPQRQCLVHTLLASLHCCLRGLWAWHWAGVCPAPVVIALAAQAQAMLWPIELNPKRKSVHVNSEVSPIWFIGAYPLVSVFRIATLVTTGDNAMIYPLSNLIAQCKTTYSLCSFPLFVCLGSCRQSFHAKSTSVTSKQRIISATKYILGIYLRFKQSFGCARKDGA